MAAGRKKTIVVNEIGYRNRVIVAGVASTGIKKRMRELGHKVIEYKGSERENFLLRNRHFQVYEDYLNFCEEVDADIAFIESIICPEHLLADLEVKKDFKPRISFLSTFREPARSLSRANVFKRLIENKYVKKAGMISMLGNKIDPPSYWKELKIDPKKYIFMSEPLITEIHDTEDIPLIEDIEIPKNKKVGLFFGRDELSKGLEDLCKAMDLINDDVHILIVAHGGGYTEERAFEMEKENSSVVYRIIGDDEIKSVYSKCDFVIMPYRKSYEYGGSGILKIAVDFNLPVIVPNLYPFNEIIDLFKIGYTFESEDERSLANTVDRMSSSLDEVKKNADFSGYEAILNTYDDLADMVLED